MKKLTDKELKELLKKMEAPELNTGYKVEGDHEDEIYTLTFTTPDGKPDLVLDKMSAYTILCHVRTFTKNTNWKAYIGDHTKTLNRIKKEREELS